MQAPPSTSAKGSCEMTPSNRAMHARALPHRSSCLPSLPEPHSQRRERARNWNGELRRAGAYQRVAGGQFSSRPLGPGPRSREGWQPFVRQHRMDTDGCSTLLFLQGLPRPRRAGRERDTRMAWCSGRPHSPGVFGVALGTASGPLKCHQAPTLCTQK